MPDLRTPNLLSQWFDAVESLTAKEQERFWNTDLARQGLWHVPNQLYLNEFEKPEEEKDWPAVLQTYSEMLLRAEKLGQPRLEASITRAMLWVIGDAKQINQLTAVAEETLAPGQTIQMFSSWYAAPGDSSWRTTNNSTSPWNNWRMCFASITSTTITRRYKPCWRRAAALATKIQQPACAMPKRPGTLPMFQRI